MSGSGPLEMALNGGQEPTIGLLLMSDELDRGQSLPRVGRQTVLGRHSKMQFRCPVLFGARIEDAYCEPILAREHERALDALQVGGFDVRVELFQVDTAVILKAGSIGRCDLEKEDQLAIVAAAFEVAPIHFRFERGHQTLVKRHFGVGVGDCPTEGGARVLGEPLIERDALESRIQRAGRTGRKGNG